jgi:uncharacterized RDD family membrane protein YckC
MKCPHCSAEISDKSAFCPACGKSVRGSDLEDLYKPKPSQQFTLPQIVPPPPPPYAQQPPYGQQPYGQVPYGTQPYGSPYGQYPPQPPYGGPGSGFGYQGMTIFSYAGFLKRFVASILDGLITGLPMIAIMFLMFSGMSQLDFTNQHEMERFFRELSAKVSTFSLFSSLLYLAYFVFFESSKFQATPGKMVLGIKVVDTDGNRLTILKAFLRNVCKYISQLICMIGYIMAAFTERKQALHDIISGCLVVDK